MTWSTSSFSERPSGLLVGDLIKIAHRLRAFAVQAANRETNFLQAAEDFVDLPREDERRQVHQYAHSHAGADIGRAGGEVAEAGMERVIDLFGIKSSMRSICSHAPCTSRPLCMHWMRRWSSFVDHQADALVWIDHDAACALRLGMFATDELALDQKLTVEAIEVADIDVKQLARGLANFQHAVAEQLFDIGAILI